MATSKTAKLEAEIVKTKAKIAEGQAKLKELEARRVEMENSEIVEIVRGMKISLEDLPLLLQELRAKAPISGQVVPKAPAPKTEKEDQAE